MLEGAGKTPKASARAGDRREPRSAVRFLLRSTFDTSLMSKDSLHHEKNICCATSKDISAYHPILKVKAIGDMSAFTVLPSSLLARSGRESLDTDSTSGSNSSTSSSGDETPQVLIKSRFDRTAETEIAIDEQVIFTLHGYTIDVSRWARAHPGGESILKRFHGRDATRAFDAVGHSDAAKAMIKEFAVDSATSTVIADPIKAFASSRPQSTVYSTASRWRRKLFTKEDPIGLHKSMGIFVLCHFFYRYVQAIFGDPSTGLGTRQGLGSDTTAMLCVIPHAVLSLSSLIFRTVPRERVVGKPMIWREFRLHSIVFGVRSVICTFFAWLAIYKDNEPAWRNCAVLMSCATVLVAMAAADVATCKFCPSNTESTTATMPYWEGCSIENQRCFKSFYAYCQFMATLACLMTSNPSWPLVVLLPIQLAALLMTLVRKGLISTKSYHMAYTASLCLPFVVGLRHLIFMKTADFAFVGIIGWTVYQLRRKGVGKYVLWLPVVTARIAVGDRFINFEVW